jgi:hypothetical protein
VVHFGRIIHEIVNTIDLDNISPTSNRNIRYRTLLVKADNSFYGVRFGSEYLDELALEFDSFNILPNETKNIIFDALSEMRGGLMIVRYHREDFKEYIEKIQQEYIINRKLFENEEGQTES